MTCLQRSSEIGKGTVKSSKENLFPAIAKANPDEYARISFAVRQMKKVSIFADYRAPFSGCVIPNVDVVRFIHFHIKDV